MKAKFKDKEAAWRRILYNTTPLPGEMLWPPIKQESAYIEYLKGLSWKASWGLRLYRLIEEEHDFKDEKEFTDYMELAEWPEDFAELEGVENG